MWTTLFFAAFILSLIALNAVATPLLQIFYKRVTNLDARSITESQLRIVQSTPSWSERYYIPDIEEDNENERHQDEDLIQEFRNSNIANVCVVCHKVVVMEETMQVMKAICSVDNIYDLVIVGKRRGPNLLLAKEMSLWVLYMELGMFGDMVASSDFYGRTMSALVIHCVEVLRDYDIGTSKPGTEFLLSNSYERSNC
ncbi:hypothetical protein Ddye_031407 [Dipteronia dyeriana]|uniref:Uncharacterized protein n=1 Tax=Dipteronia dyeriana TaxID=168575 RepID=A0AAD9WNP1_9ROSI|nr:hypothetical protein Ddye_031407 [Dipteronia dyeriana]